MNFNMNQTLFLTWTLMRFSWIDCTLSEVRQRHYRSKDVLTIPSKEIKICDKKIDFLKDKNQEQQRNLHQIRKTISHNEITTS